MGNSLNSESGKDHYEVTEELQDMLTVQSTAIGLDTRPARKD